MAQFINFFLDWGILSWLKMFTMSADKLDSRLFYRHHKKTLSTVLSFLGFKNIPCSHEGSRGEVNMEVILTFR